MSGFTCVVSVSAYLNPRLRRVQDSEDQTIRPVKTVFLSAEVWKNLNYPVL